MNTIGSLLDLRHDGQASSKKKSRYEIWKTAQFEMIYPLKMVLVHSYVKLPAGVLKINSGTVGGSQGIQEHVPGLWIIL